MRKIIDPFLFKVPELDIHGFNRSEAVANAKIFIDDYSKTNNKKLLIIHGKGERVLRKAIHEYLSHDKRVLSYNTISYNDGETLIILK